MILSEEECNEIISWQNLYGKANVRECGEVCHPAGLSKSKLDYFITEVPRDTNTQWFFDLLSDYISDEYPDNSVDKKDFFYLHEFTVGHRFTKHIDRNRQDDWKLILGGILNDKFKGGKLLTYNPDGELATKKGELYRMNASVLHEVTEITEGTRFSFVCFTSHDYLYSSKSIL